MPFYSLNQLPKLKLFPGFDGHAIHTEQLTVAYWNIAQDAVLPMHSHVHEQLTHILAGKLELTIGDETQILLPGMVAVIPSHVPHGGRALEDCYALDVFSPVREDYMALGQL